MSILTAESTPMNRVVQWQMNNNGHVLWATLHISRMKQISRTDVRRRWRAGRGIDSRGRQTCTPRAQRDTKGYPRKGFSVWSAVADFRKTVRGQQVSITTLLVPFERNFSRRWFLSFWAKGCLVYNWKFTCCDATSMIWRRRRVPLLL